METNANFKPIAALCGVVLVLLAACAPDRPRPGGDPVAFPALFSTEPPEQAPAAVPRQTRPGRFLGFLSRKRDPAPVPDTPESAAPIDDAEIAASPPEPARRPRLFGFLGKRGTEAVDPPAPDLLAAAPPSDYNAKMPPMPAIATPGLLPFGEVLRVCGLKRADLGVEVARAHGSGFRLFDTDPTGTTPRSQFLTGFKDGCPRQFTASLALFGAPDVHETTRYNPVNTTPYSQVDLAYEKVKNRVCGVRKGQFCPEKRAAKLRKQATFVTVYPEFGGSGEWLEIFLHNGQMVTYQRRN